MKLNLLPTYVSKEKSTRVALLLGVLILIVCVLLAGFLMTKGNRDLAESQDGLSDLQAQAKKAKDTADAADTVLAKATPLLRNSELAKAMLAHNSVYPDLYDDLRQYIPSFFRVNSMSAAATGPGQSSVTLVGVIDTYQQYADLMLALLRIPGVSSVSREGFTDNLPYVPAPTPEDQFGRPHKPGEGPIPDDPLKRLEYFEARGTLDGYTGAGGFGSGVPGTRGPMPKSQQITITILLARDLQTPDPRATLALNAGSGGGGGPAAGGGNLPSAGGRQGGG
jgi:hypothetical protein